MIPVPTAELPERIGRDWHAARPDINPEPMLTVIAVQRTSARLHAKLEAFFAQYELTSPAFGVPESLSRAERRTLRTLLDRIGVGKGQLFNPTQWASVGRYSKLAPSVSRCWKNSG